MYYRTSIKIYKYIYLGTFSRLSGLRLTYLKRNLGPLSDWFKFGRNNIYIYTYRFDSSSETCLLAPFKYFENVQTQ